MGNEMSQSAMESILFSMLYLCKNLCSKLISLTIIARAPIQSKIRRKRIGKKLETMRERGEARKGQDQAGHSKGQHGSGSNTCRKRHTPKEPIAQLFKNECPSRCCRQ